MKRQNKNIKKKTGIVISVIVIILVIIQILVKIQSNQLYQKAIKTLQGTELRLDGSSEVSEELLIALNNAEYKQPENIILMIGDGMGYNIIEATQRVYRESLYNETLAMNYMPFQNSHCTYSVDSDVTDSAAGATALATGFKTANKVVSMDYMSRESFESILELAAQKGKSTGIIATKSVTDATPAAFTTHVSSRDMQTDIAEMQLKKIEEGLLDLVLGGGRSYYEHESNKEFLISMQASGMNYVNCWEEIYETDLPIVGLFSEKELDTLDDTIPTIAEMTDFALNILDDNEEGFFLMVEGSQIDTYGEKNTFERQVKEVYDFDCAVAVAMRYVALNPNTVLIITADHETGDLWIPEKAEKESEVIYEYGTYNHTNKMVPIFAAGYGVEALSGFVENTDIGIFIASLLGENEFGQKSTQYKILNDAISVKFDENNREYTIIHEDIPELQESKEFVNVFYLKVTNNSEEVEPTPVLTLRTAGRNYTIKSQLDYIDPDQTLLLGYTLPFEYRKYNKFSEIEELVFTVENADAEFEFSSMTWVARTFGK